MGKGRTRDGEGKGREQGARITYAFDHGRGAQGHASRPGARRGQGRAGARGPCARARRGAQGREGARRGAKGTQGRARRGAHAGARRRGARAQELNVRTAYAHPHACTLVHGRACAHNGCVVCTQCLHTRTIPSSPLSEQHSASCSRCTSS